jgi:hypothetical protein
MKNKKDDWFVHDARTGGVTGPYASKNDAAKLAADLNALVHKNSALGFLAASITGPFYARGTGERLF